MRLPTIRLTLLATVAVTLLLAPAANAWVREESQRWVWYVPSHSWADAQSDNGIDISSPTGVLYVGHGFGQTPGPVSHQEVVDYAVRSRGLDVHRLRGVRFTSRSRVVEKGGIARRIYQWRGYRTNRRQSVRGVLTVDVMNNDASFTYGFATYNRVAPTRLFQRWNRRLAFIQRHILLQPRTPDWGF
jgi:hypothetical protein